MGTAELLENNKLKLIELTNTLCETTYIIRAAQS